ncbi:hypothetical protein BGX33_010105 [Mortierella sp. NVP41]|nr:hypothetical protein BGX33_010105 [Mortierella sp. NVP41]
MNTSALSTTNSTTTLPITTTADAPSNQQAATSFSISDFLVPGLQTKVWDDWQGADVLNDYSAFDTQDFSSDLNGDPFQFGLDGLMGNAPIWDNNAIPADQAYDEFVFDLAPSAFETPATVNVADLIVGPNSSAVSPMDLTMSSVDMYQDLALANLYGFTEPTTGSDSGSDSEQDEDGSDDSDQDETVNRAATPVTAPMPIVETQPTTPVVQCQQPMAPVAAKRDDPNKRRMEEALVARINNDLGPEHMAGLFKILKGSSGQDAGEDEDEEMEVDLSSLDETTLVEVYHYVETCCMQTMRSIWAAEERERVAIAAAKAAAAAAAAQAQAEAEAMERQRQRYYAERTPELSPGHSSASSSSPSPPHPSSGSSTKGRRSNGYNKKRSPVQSTPVAPYQVADDLEQDALWTAGHPTKSKRKRASHGGSTGVGGGGTDKGRRIQRDLVHQQQHFLHQQQSMETVVVLRATAADDDDEMEYGEDAEIDVVG